jgi:hypothetical protein
MQAALATLVGTAASYGYLRWLIHDMRGLSRATVQPFQDARAAHAQPLRALVLALAAYRCLPHCCTLHKATMKSSPKRVALLHQLTCDIRQDFLVFRLAVAFVACRVCMAGYCGELGVV